MRCIVEGNNIRFLGKSIHSLARIGEDIYLETKDQKVLFQSVNSSRSAYASFSFESLFFSKFEKRTEVKCKISLKSCLLAFRSLFSMEKSVERCLIDASSVVDHLLVEFECRKGITKSFHLPFMVNESVQTDFPSDNYQCKFTAQSRLLIDGMQNFNNLVEELTLTVCFDRLTFKNYVDDEPDPNKIVLTELTLESDEFEEYEVQQEMEVTFCLKELRSLLSFAEGSNVPVNIYCQGAGRPIMFSMQTTSGMKSEFVLATLAEVVTSQISQTSGISADKNSVERAPTHSKKTSRKRKLVTAAENHKVKATSNSSLSEIPEKDPEIPEVAPAIFSSAVSTRTSQDASLHREDSKTQDGELPHREDSRIHEDDFFQEEDSSDIFENDAALRAGPVEDNDVIPSTPPRKTIFKLFSLSQASPPFPPEDDEVLAPCSDEEGY